MSRAVRFRQIFLSRAPGLPQGLGELELSEGLTVLLGPNGAGKSTLARTLAGTLWRAPEGHRAEGTARLDDEVVAFQQRDGATVWDGERPQVPEGTGARYRFDLKLLLAPEDKEHDGLGQLLARDVLGGLDLASYPEPKRPPSRKDLREAEDALRRNRDEARGRLDELDRKRARMAEELAQTQEADRRGDAVRRLQELREAERRATERQAEVARFDGRQAGLRARDADDVAEAVRRAEEARSRVEGAERELDELGHPDGPSVPVRDAEGLCLEGFARQWEEAERRLSDHEQRRAEAAGKRQAWADAVRERTGQEPASLGDPTLAAKFGRIYEDLAGRAAERDAWDRVERWLPPVPEVDEGRLDALAAYLGAEPVPERGGSAGAYTALAGAAVGLVGALLMLASPGPVGIVLASLGALVAFAGGLLSLRRGQDKPSVAPPEGVRDRAEAASRYRREADGRARAAQAEELRRHWDGNARPQRDQADADARALAEKRDRLASVLGWRSDGAFTLSRLGVDLAGWRDANLALAAATEARDAAEVELDRTRLQALAALQGYGGATAAAPAELRAAAARLARATELADLRAKARTDEARAGTQRDEIEERVGASAEEIARLEEARPDYEAALREAQLAEGAVRRAREAAPDSLDLTTLDEEGLRCEEERMKELRGRRDEQVKELERNEGEIRSLKEGTEAARLALRLEEERAKFEVAEGRWLDDAARFVVARAVEAALEETEKPQVLQEANEVLDAATSGRYCFRHRAGGLRLEDKLSQQVLRDDQLSDGTRVQARLALRLGFVRAEEVGDRPPLFLDETLANSDPFRAQTIARFILGEVQTGRQVFALTSQPAEAAIWMMTAEQMGVCACLVDLDRERPKSLDWRTEWIDRSRPLPDPGLGHVAYREALRGHTLDPWQPCEGLLLTHLMLHDEEVTVVHECLETGRDTWAQARDWMPEPHRSRFAARVRLLRGALEEWRKGRRQDPFGPDEKPGQWGRDGWTRFLSANSDLALRPHALLEAFIAGRTSQIPRSAPMDRLRAFIEEACPEGPERSPDEVRRCALHAVGDALSLHLTLEEADQLLNLIYREP